MSETPQFKFGQQCEHGQLARQCDICDRDREIAALRAELAEYKEDAERYRFLKARCLSEYYAEDDDGTLCIHFLCDFENYNDPDAAIDKARGS